MNKVWAITFTVITFLIQDLFAQIVRPTTFDDRLTCEASKGIWREFGSDCMDQCRSKLEKYPMCVRLTISGCECGKGRCWDGDSCVVMSDYKKTFEIEQAKEQKILDEAKEKRKAAALANQQEMMDKFVKNTADPNSAAPAANPADQPVQNPSNPYSAPVPQPLNQQDPEPTNPITQIPAQPVPLSDLPKDGAPQNNQDVRIEIPEFFLKKQAQQKIAQEIQQKNDAEKNGSKPSAASIPPLPIVPLPNQ